MEACFLRGLVFVVLTAWTLADGKKDEENCISMFANSRGCVSLNVKETHCTDCALFVRRTLATMFTGDSK